MSCEMPQMPTVNAKFTIPLTNEHYDIYRLKKDLENGKDSLELTIVGDSVLLTINHKDTILIGDHLDADPVEDSTNGLISNDLKLRDSTTTTFSLGFLGPGSIDALHGTSVTIPAFNIPVRNRSVAFSNFSAATVLSGSVLRTTVTNGTQTNFDSLKVVIIDQTNATIDSYKVAVNASGGVQTPPKIFTSTTTLNMPLSLRVSGHSTGSGTSVTVDTSSSVSIKLVVDVTGSSITGKFPSQTIVRADSFKSSTNSVIDTGYIETGKLTLNFTNLDLPVSAWLYFSSSDFDSAGLKLSRAFRIPTGTPVVLKLDKWKVIPSGASIGNQYLNYEYTIRTDSAVSDLTISNNQGLKVKATLDTMKFSRLRAKLAQEEVTLDRTSQVINIKHLDSIQIKRAFFEIITNHRIPFPMSLDITITGIRIPNVTKAAHIIASIPAYTAGVSRRDTIRTTNYQEVADLLSVLPDSIITSGKVLIGDNIASGAVQREDSMTAQINLRAPLVFSLPIDTARNVIKTGPDSISLSEKQKERLYDRLKSVTISGKILNHFPVPISVQFLIDSSRAIPPSKTRFFDSTSALRFIFPSTPLEITKGIMDMSSGVGIVTDAAEITFNYPLDQSEYQKIFDPNIDTVRAAIYRGLIIKLNGTGGPVQVSADDFIDVKADLEFEYEVGKHIDE